MATTTILLWLFFILGVSYTGYTIKELNENGFNDVFKEQLTKFIDNCKNNVDWYNKNNATAKFIEEYTANHPDATSETIAQSIYKGLTNTSTNIITVAKKVWDVFREFVSAIVQGLLKLSIPIGATPVSTPQEIAQACDIASNWDEVTASPGKAYAALELISTLLAAGVSFKIFQGRIKESAAADTDTNSYTKNCVSTVFAYICEKNTLTSNSKTFTASNGTKLSYYTPILDSSRYTIDENWHIGINTANVSYSAVSMNPHILNGDGGNLWDDFTMDGEQINVGYHICYIVVSALYNATKLTMAKYFSGQTSLPYGSLTDNTKVYTPTSSTAKYYYVSDVDIYPGMYTKYDQWTWVQRYLTSDGVTDIGALGDVYLKINEDQTADVVTPGRVTDDTNVIDGPVSTGYTDAWVESYPTNTTVADVIDGSDTATVDTATDSKVITDADTQTDVLDNATTITDTVDEINNNPSAVVPPIVPPPTIGITSSGFITLFNPTLSQLSMLNDILWSEDFITNFLKMINDPVDGIISLMAVPITPSTGGSQSVRLGNYDSGISMPKVSNQFGTFSCGSIVINETFGNFMDYAPYTSVQLYLPFVGIVKLSTNEVMGATVSVNYNIDFLTGECLAQVGIAKKGISATSYVYNGNMAMQLPITGANYSRFYSSIVKGAASIGAAALTGGAALPVVAGTAALNAGMNAGADIQKAGSISGNSGFLGDFTPYVIVTMPSLNRDSDYDEYEGNVVNKTVTLGNMSGYTRCKEVHVSSKTATVNELQEIEQLLKVGVLL